MRHQQGQTCVATAYRQCAGEAGACGSLKRAQAEHAKNFPIYIEEKYMIAWGYLAAVTTPGN